MNWYQLFYLMTTADRLQQFFDVLSDIATTFAIIGIIGLIIAIIGYSSSTASDYNEQPSSDTKSWLTFRRTCIWWLTVTVPIAILAWFLYIATPSKKDALLIVAGGAVGSFITSDSSASKLPSDITNFLRAKIIAETKELNLEGILPEKDTLKDLSKEQLIELIKKQ